MPSVIAGTRAKMQMLFQKDGFAFDPQQVLFTAVFTPVTVGVPPTKYAYTYNVDAQIVRSSVGIYYVEQVFDAVGSMSFTWRSTFFGEELNMEAICKVVARAVVE